MKAKISGILAIVFLLQACAYLGLAKPETFNEKVAVAYATVSEVAKSTNTLLKANKISKAEALDVHTRATEAITTIEAAELVYGANPTEAETRVLAALAVLQTLEAFLQSRGQ